MNDISKHELLSFLRKNITEQERWIDTLKQTGGLGISFYEGYRAGLIDVRKWVIDYLVEQMLDK